MITLRTTLLLAVAVVAAGTTAIGAGKWLELQRRQPVQAAAPAVVQNPTVRVLVAAADLPAGQVLRQQHLAWANWPADGAKDDFVRDEGKPHSLDGAVVRSLLLAGEPVTERRVVRSGDRGFLAAMLTPGLRAVSVEIDAATGIAGLVFPGDRVDVVLTHVISQNDNTTRRASETVLQDIRVLALDQRVDDQTGKPALAKTATLELSAKQVEVVTVAAELGRLSLSLRSLAMAETAEPPAQPAVSRFTLDSEASALIARRPPPRPGTGPEVVVVRGSEGGSGRLRSASARLKEATQ